MSGGVDFNAIAGAALASVLAVMGLGIAAETIYHPSYPEKAGFLPDVSETPDGGGPAAPQAPDFGVLFADAGGVAEMVTRGERVHQQCLSCHTFGAGEANGIGPNLHDVFGRTAGTHGGFEYSEAMAGYGQQWNFQTLDHFLTSPSGAVRGTKMAFAGIRRVEDRVALIAYLRSMSPLAGSVAIPAPLPVETAEAPAGETTAETTTAAPAAPAGGGH